MQERISQQRSQGSQLGQCVLYFGCRRCDQDFLYGQQLQQWADQGLLTLYTAFSRQQVSVSYHMHQGAVSFLKAMCALPSICGSATEETSAYLMIALTTILGLSVLDRCCSSATSGTCKSLFAPVMVST